jgi:hypothetical protein
VWIVQIGGVQVSKFLRATNDLQRPSNVLNFAFTEKEKALEFKNRLKRLDIKADLFREF